MGFPEPIPGDVWLDEFKGKKKASLVLSRLVGLGLVGPCPFSLSWSYFKTKVCQSLDVKWPPQAFQLNSWPSAAEAAVLEVLEH